MSNEEVNYVIPESVLLAIGRYLSKRPWDEVCEVMPVLQGLRKASEEAYPEEKEKPIP